MQLAESLVARNDEAATDRARTRPMVGDPAMELPRRQFLLLAAAAATPPAPSSFAWAQAYPTRPVRWIVPFPPGGVTDIAARLIGQWLSDRLGQPFVVENRPGAASNIGTEVVVRAPPDGYTVLLVGLYNAINATLYDNLSFNFMRDIAPVARIIAVPLVMVVNPSVPAKSVPEFIAYAKANPGKLNMASPGNGTPPHVAGELFKIMTGVNMLHVPYRGSAPAMTDLLSGQIQVMFDALPTSIEHIRATKLRPLAVTTASRSDVLPDIPPMNDTVAGYEASGWLGVGGPKNLPAGVIERLNGEIDAALSDPAVRMRFADLGAKLLPASPAEFGRFIADETEKWGKVVKLAGIKPE
jgi:tripartite-type tricarboxylate transporter receptor subunit TctC